MLPLKFDESAPFGLFTEAPSEHRGKFHHPARERPATRRPQANLMNRIIIPLCASPGESARDLPSNAENGKPDVAMPVEASDRLLIALSNPDNVSPLINLALMLRTPGAPSPLTALFCLALAVIPLIVDESVKLFLYFRRKKSACLGKDAPSAHAA